MGWCVALVALALAVSVSISARVLLSRVDGRLAAELVHEGAKLRAYADRAVDQGTGRPFATVDALLTGFLRDDLPESDETFFSVVGGVAAHRSPQQPLARLDLDPTVVAFAANAADPTTRTFSTPAGPAVVGVFPVRMTSDPTPAALVVVQFAAPARAQAWSVIRLLTLIGLLALLGAGGAAWLVAGRVLAPIRQVRQTAERIGGSDLSARIDVTGNDDVAQLAATFNQMLERLQVAFDTQRDFLNDAGHELRTPLTILRGHLELMGDDPEERAATTALLIDEVDRMRRLVDDLILLSQARRPDFLHPGTVDLTEVVVDLVAKASSLAVRRWRIDTLAEGRMWGDGQRLTQALMQLAANAVAHTADGDTIAAGSSTHAGRVRLWVRDNGSGIALPDARRIFERGVQGPGSRPGTGSGLGLAIVSSIAAAHGGQVLLDSAPGSGATFTLDLPWREPPEPDTGGDDRAGGADGQESALVDR